MKVHFKEVRFQKGAFSPEDFPVPSLPEVAFLGRSNVGKSSLINAFLRQKGVARVSSTPGFTKAINFFRVDHRFFLVDLPGYGFAKVSPKMRAQWKTLVESYLSASRPIKLLVLIFDIRREPDELDRALIDYVKELGRPFIVVLNKIDRLKKSSWPQARKRWQEGLGVEEENVFLASCKEGKGIEEIRKRILQALEK
ncbi:MAG: YihA family ribosome biogenesis GTP-binding protein [Thermodesulfobacteria bacterium]|nr:YihA family ribosome biogenesis GTP-binding protein [Thermodesulfobacteriota bacterium]